MSLPSSPLPLLATITRPVCGPISSCNTLSHNRGLRASVYRSRGGFNVATATHSPAPTGQIGIVSFLVQKSYFVTGATGFLAKVLVEKMLRTVPDGGKMYLLIKAKDNGAAMKRLKSEIIESEVFRCLRRKHGERYEEWMMSKLIPVVGDISKPKLGMEADSIAALAKEIDVIVSSAANTTLDERYDVALNMNTTAPARLMSFAQKCQKLCVFLHISTATYVNGEREGIVWEKAMLMGQSIVTNACDDELDLDVEIKLASNFVNVKTMKDLGSQRSKRYGWQNVYLMSKAMGEMVIDSERGETPVVIIRPSIVESTYREPFPGWIQGNKVLDPLILSYAKARLPGFLADPRAIADVVPADMVVNAVIAAMAKHGLAAKPELSVYHVASSVVNPLLVGEVFKFSHDHFASRPLSDSNGTEIAVSPMEFLSSLDEFAAYIRNAMARQSGVLEGTLVNAQRIAQKLCSKKAEHITHTAKMYQPYMFYKGWFGNANTQRLMEEMSTEEALDFGFDVRGVNWRHYFTSVHIPGLKRHVLKMKGV